MACRVALLFALYAGLQLSAFGSFLATNDTMRPVLVSFYNTNSLGQYIFGGGATVATNTTGTISSNAAWLGVTVINQNLSVMRANTWAALANTNGAKCSYLSTNGALEYYTVPSGSSSAGSVTNGATPTNNPTGPVPVSVPITDLSVTNLLEQDGLVVVPYTNVTGAVTNSVRIFGPWLGSNYIQKAIWALPQFTNKNIIGGGKITVVGINYTPTPLLFSNFLGGVASFNLQASAFTGGTIVCATNPCIRVYGGQLNASNIGTVNFKMKDMEISSMDDSPTNVFEVVGGVVDLDIENNWFNYWGYATNDFGMVTPSFGLQSPPITTNNLVVSINGIYDDKFWFHGNSLWYMAGLYWHCDHGSIYNNFFTCCGASTHPFFADMGITSSWSATSPESLGGVITSYFNDIQCYNNYFYGAQIGYVILSNSPVFAPGFCAFDAYESNPQIGVAMPTGVTFPQFMTTLLGQAATNSMIPVTITFTNGSGGYGYAAGQITSSINTNTIYMSHFTVPQYNTSPFNWSSATNGYVNIDGRGLWSKEDGPGSGNYYFEMGTNGFYGGQDEFSFNSITPNPQSAFPNNWLTLNNFNGQTASAALEADNGHTLNGSETFNFGTNWTLNATPRQWMGYDMASGTWRAIGGFKIDTLFGTLTNIQPTVTYGGTPGATNYNSSGNTITVFATVTNATMVVGSVVSQFALIASPSVPIPSTAIVQSVSTYAGALGTNITPIWGFVSNGWSYAWTNLGGPPAATGTNYLRSGSAGTR